MDDIDDLFGGPSPGDGAVPGVKSRTRPIGPAAQDGTVVELGARLPPSIYLGTSSWSFPGWSGLVYDTPARESDLSRSGLNAYARHPLLRTVGIDRGFYKPLAAAEFGAYAAQVPESFRFMVKAPALVTDEVNRDDKGRATGNNPHFLDDRMAFEQFAKPAIAGLDEKAGPLVFQFSPLSRASLADVPALVARLHAFLFSLVRRCANFSHPPLFAVEVRNPELLTREFADALRNAGARYCLGIHDRMPDAKAQLPLLRALWPGPMVVRWNLHAGRKYGQAKADYAPFNRLIDEDPPTRTTLAKVAAATARAGYPVYIVANNKAEGSAPLTLAKLAEAITAATPAD